MIIDLDAHRSEAAERNRRMQRAYIDAVKEVQLLRLKLAADLKATGASEDTVDFLLYSMEGALRFGPPAFSKPDESA